MTNGRHTKPEIQILDAAEVPAEARFPEVSFGFRVTLLLALGALLVLGRADWLPAPWSWAVWPILGSMFIFRLVVYLYDLRHHENVPFSLWRSLGDFFLLPNVCFPLLSVIDYERFRRAYHFSITSNCTCASTRQGSTTRCWHCGWTIAVQTDAAAHRLAHYECVTAPSFFELRETTR